MPSNRSSEYEQPAHVEYDGVEYFAAEDSRHHNCHTSTGFSCAFETTGDTTGDNIRCRSTPCDGVIWLTQNDYITHRLTK